jgi:hypothetical protein
MLQPLVASMSPRRKRRTMGTPVPNRGMGREVIMTRRRNWRS